MPEEWPIYEKRLSERLTGTYALFKDNKLYTELEDDFDKYQTWAEAETPWILNVGSDVTALDPTITAGVGGLVRLTTGKTDGTTVADASQIIGANPWQVGSGPLIFSCRLRVNTAATGLSLIAGFTDVTTLEEPATIAVTTITTTFTDGCVFAYDTDATIDGWYVIGVSNNTDATGNGLARCWDLNAFGAGYIAPVADIFQVLRIEVHSDSKAIFYVNGYEVGRLTANTTRLTTNLYPTVIACATTAGTARIVDVDRIYVQGLRTV